MVSNVATQMNHHHLEVSKSKYNKVSSYKVASGNYYCFYLYGLKFLS
jgi:hypothetical protein